MPITKATASSIAPAAKGDLVVGSATNDASVLAVGSANQVLTVDSSTSTGLKWAAPAGSSFVGCSVDKSGVQSLANNTEVLITWDLENYDTDGFHSTVTNTGRMTIPSGKGGYYTVSGALAFDTDNTGMRYAVIYKNGAVFEYLGGGRAATGSGVNAFATMSVTFSAVAGDYFEIYGFQNSGNSQNLSALSHFQISYLGA